MYGQIVYPLQSLRTQGAFLFSRHTTDGELIFDIAFVVIYVYIKQIYPFDVGILRVFSCLKISDIINYAIICGCFLISIPRCESDISTFLSIVIPSRGMLTILCPRCFFQEYARLRGQRGIFFLKSHLPAKARRTLLCTFLCSTPTSRLPLDCLFF